MLTLQEIEKAITHLTPAELAQLRAWFDAYDAQVWDAQFEADVQTGKLDKLAERALQEYRAG